MLFVFAVFDMCLLRFPFLRFPFKDLLSAHNCSIMTVTSLCIEYMVSTIPVAYIICSLIVHRHLLGDVGIALRLGESNTNATYNHMSIPRLRDRQNRDWKIVFGFITDTAPVASRFSFRRGSAGMHETHYQWPAVGFLSASVVCASAKASRSTR